MLSALSLLLIGPLRDAPVTAPVLPVLGTLILFVVPGIVLASMFLGSGHSLPAQVPLVFTLSAGIFGLLALPPLVLKWSPETYLNACAGVLALSLAGTVLLILRSPRTEPEVERDALERGGRWLWIPLLSLTATLAAVSPFVYHPPKSDTWAYLMYVRKFLELEQLNVFPSAQGFGRSTLAGWLLEQATISRVSGVDPVDLALTYLEPALIVVAILSFYALARTLFESEPAALLTGCLAALFFLLQLNPLSPIPDGEFVGHMVEDKYVVRFIFLPVALSLAVLFLRERKLRYLGLFTLVCWSTVPIHPIGLAIIGVSMVGFGLVHLALDRRDWRAWISFGALIAAMLSVVLPPAAYLLAVGEVDLSRIREIDLPRMDFAAPGEAELYLNSLLLSPVMFVVYLAGVPFLMWRMKRDLAARLLVGILLFVPFLVYLPPFAALVDKIIGLRLLDRLSWPVLPAALLTLGWMSWELLKYARSYSGRFRLPARVAPILPVIFMGALMAAAAPWIVSGVRSANHSGEVAPDETSCLDPAFGWTSDIATARRVMLAPIAESVCVQAYEPSILFVSYRGTSTTDGEVPQNVADVRTFFGSPAVDEEMIEILQHYGVHYVLLPANSPLNGQLDHLPAFTPMDNPGERYRVYEVEWSKLAVTPVVEMNGHLNDKEWDAVLEIYDEALQGDEDERFLAYLAAGRAYMQKGALFAAPLAYKGAAEIFPESPVPYSGLADAYMRAKKESAARVALQKAVSLAPQDVKPRLKFGKLLLKLRIQKKAVEQYREVVELYPDVPSYRVLLGKALIRAGERETAEEEFDRALRLDPLSPDLNLQLGLLYARLSQNGEDERYSELAAKHLEKAAKLASSESHDNVYQSRKAYFALGELYERQERTEEAIAAYEQALEVSPEFKPARKKLEELRE